jgi:hypothetical protein
MEITAVSFTHIWTKMYNKALMRSEKAVAVDTAQDYRQQYNW